MRGGRSVLIFAAITSIYALTAYVGLRWSVVPGAGSPVWPASGVALAALVLAGLRYWPAIFLGRFAAALLVGASLPLWADVLIALASAAGAALSATLLRALRFDPHLRTMRDMLVLALFGAGAGAAVSAGLGAAVLLLAGVAPPLALHAGLNWGLGAAGGVLVCAPLILSWAQPRTAKWRVLDVGHMLLQFSAGAAASAIVFLDTNHPWLRVWHLYPLFIWAALAFRVRGVSAMLLIVSVFAVAGAAQGTGPLSETPGPGGVLLLTQQFIAMTALTMLILGAAIDQRRGVEAQARLAAIVSSSSDAIMSFSTDGRVQSWNRGAERLFGYPAADVIGQHGRFLLPPEQPEGGGGVFAMALHGGPVQVETVRVARDGARIDVQISANRMIGPGGRVLGVASVMRDIRERRRAEAQQRQLINELNHRVKNTLAIVQGLAQQSFRRPGTVAARAAFEGRLIALAAAHNLLTETGWTSAPLREIVSQVLAPYGNGTGSERFDLFGPELQLPPRIAVALAMALHELATNAAKYGALSVAEGWIEIGWERIDGRFRLVWRERGGPPVSPPARRGFGTRLIERGLASDLSGSVQIDFACEGVICTIDAPLPPDDVAGVEQIGR